MIDQQLITLAQAQSVNAFMQRTATPSDQLWTVDSVFPESLLQSLQNYLVQADTGSWESVPEQKSWSRLKISWESDTVVEELHNTCEGLTEAVNSVYPGQHKYFWGISIWKDTAGYEIGWHTDNPDIDVAMQIYLFGDGKLGTTFLINEQEFVVPGVHNSGYVACYSDRPRLSHRSQGTVPAGQIRYSLYVIWSRFPKHDPNAQ
jgi:hypothetical protein